LIASKEQGGGDKRRAHLEKREWSLSEVREEEGIRVKSEEEE
jgi:hypothetical protein